MLEMDWPGLSRRASRLKASEIRELLKLVHRPGMISFAGGIPEPSLFDVDHFRRLHGDYLSDDKVASQALQYSTSEGHPALREWIATSMNARGVACSADNILITSGSQQALDLIARLFLDEGDRVYSQWPTYLGALNAFNACGPEFAPLDLTDGADILPAKLIYVVPDFANPTGETLTLNERLRVLEAADASGAMIIEDAAYTDLRFEGAPVPPLAALDEMTGGDIRRVIYCGTFSKTLSPALRAGWACGPAPVIRRLTLLKQSADLHTSTLNQMVMLGAAEEGYGQKVSKALRVYGERRDGLLSALDRHAVPGMSWTRPEGGLFVWVTLPEALDAAVLLERALSQNVAFVPGGAFFPDGSGRNTLRLSYSLATAETADVGIARLCGLVNQMMGEGEALNVQMVV